ncbi:MAG: hypothetical protein ACRC8S_14900 [Fimbriiglobus sp.]
MSETFQLHDRIQSRRPSVLPVPEDTDACDDLASYGLLRGNKERSLMLNFRLLDGTQDAFPLTLLERILYDPSFGITLRFVGVLVLIEGVNLAMQPPSSVGLLDGLHRHRVPWIAEVDALHNAAKPQAGIVVTKIRIQTVY